MENESESREKMLVRMCRDIENKSESRRKTTAGSPFALQLLSLGRLSTKAQLSLLLSSRNLNSY